jgi:hypothetical protein
MSTRRQFPKEATAVGAVAAAAAARIVTAGTYAQPSATTRRSTSSAGAWPIKSVVRREETILRYGGDGDNFHMTWAADDRQYVSLSDGQGWFDNPTGGWCFNSRLYSVQGGPRSARFDDVPGYPRLTPRNELVMFRVPKAQFLNRSAYEYFAGLQANGHATWTKGIGERAVVHTFPRGWENDPSLTKHDAYGWTPSVTSNAPLRLYMITSWETGQPPNGELFGGPSYLDLWVASRPWGPWRQINEETAWCSGNDLNARTYSPQIAPKWIAKGSKSFWLVWTDYQNLGGQNALSRPDKLVEKTADPNKAWQDTLDFMRKCMPYYAFNTQRVVLVTT